MIAMFHGTAFLVSYILGSITGLLIAAAMLRSSVFSRTTAYLRIGSSVFDFGIFIPGVGLFISLFSVLFLLVFNILVARRLLQLGSSVLKADEQ
jgi:large-conductance mechanosensitive channel